MIRIASLAVFALAMQACPPAPNPPAPDASDAAVADAAPAPVDASPPPAPADASTPSAQACANLARLGCAEGQVSNCAATLDHVAATKLTKIDVPCLIAAKSKAGAAKCGSVACP